MNNGPYGVSRSTFYNLPRLAFDWLPIQNLTLGGAVWLYADLSATESTSTGGTSKSTDQPKVTYWGIAPRVGYVIPMGDKLSFWPRAGIEYHDVSTSNVGAGSGSVTQFAIDVEAMLVISPWNHFGFTVGADRRHPHQRQADRDQHPDGRGRRRRPDGRLRDVPGRSHGRHARSLLMRLRMTTRARAGFHFAGSSHRARALPRRARRVAVGAALQPRLRAPAPHPRGRPRRCSSAGSARARSSAGRGETDSLCPQLREGGARRRSSAASATSRTLVDGKPGEIRARIRRGGRQARDGEDVPDARPLRGRDVDRPGVHRAHRAPLPRSRLPRAAHAACATTARRASSTGAAACSRSTSRTAAT